MAGRYVQSQGLQRACLILISLILMLLCGFAVGFSNIFANVKPTAPNIMADQAKASADQIAKLAELEAPGQTPEEKAADGWGNFLWRKALASILPIDFVNRQIDAKIAENRGSSITGFVLAKAIEGVLPWCFWQDNTNPGLDQVVIPGKFDPDDEKQFFWNQPEAAAAKGQAQVAIYSTHSAETYTPFAGDSKVAGKHGGVYVASTVLAQNLTAKGIKVVVDPTVHDYPDWNASYANSRMTASQLLADNQDLQILIDMHRDAGVPKEGSTTVINGRSAAKIMFVVGSAARYNHENWQQNKAFAEKIGAKMDEMYPGLLKKIRVQDGRYNQHLSNKAILVEMGATENTIAEVEYSSKMLAAVLAAVLAE